MTDESIKDETTASDAGTGAPRVSSSAERSRLHRERQREGRQMLALEITKAQIDRLVEAKLLDPDKRADRDALAAAVAASLDRDGTRPEAAQPAQLLPDGYAHLDFVVRPGEIDYFWDAAPHRERSPINVGWVGDAMHALIRSASQTWLSAGRPRNRTWRSFDPPPRPRTPEEQAELARWREEQARLVAEENARIRAAIAARGEEPVAPVREMPVSTQRLWFQSFVRSGGKWPFEGPAPGLPGSVITREALDAFGLAHLHDRGRIEIELPEQEDIGDPLDALRSPDSGTTRHWR